MTDDLTAALVAVAETVARMRSMLVKYATTDIHEAPLLRQLREEATLLGEQLDKADRALFDETAGEGV